METGMTVAYELIRSKRRTIAIVIDSCLLYTSDAADE